MPLTVSCPYCNTPIPVPDPPPASGRVFCQRCEEAVSVAGAVAGNSAAPAAESARPSRPSNRAIAGLVIAVMLGMAALGLAFALRTVDFRRANDTKGAQPPEPMPETRQAPPVEWPGLGYLPDGVQAIAGIRVADATRSSAGQALLARLGLGQESTLLGIAPKDVDCLIVGVSWRTLPPRVIAVAHGKFDDVKPSGRTLSQHGKQLERMKPWPNGPDAVIWRPESRTLVATQLPEDFDRIPERPRPTAPLSKVLMDRRRAHVLAWLVAEVDTTALGLAGGFGLLPKRSDDLWNNLEALAVNVSGNPVSLDAEIEIRGRTENTGDAIANELAESLSKAGLTPGRGREYDRGEDWQRVTVTADAEKLAGWLRKR